MIPSALRFIVAAAAAPAVFALNACVTPEAGVDHDPQLTLARQVPGFGGFYLDEHGEPVVYLTDPSARADAVAALRPMLEARGLDPEALRVVEGAYDYQQLYRWFSVASDAVLGMPQVVFVDLDEEHQRIHVGVAGSEADRAAVARRLRRRGLPDAAFTVEPSPRIEPFITTSSSVRPVIGGLALNKVPFGFGCTHGFNVSRTERGNVRDHRRSFVTNSHCTREQGGVEGTEFGQPLVGARIGVEIDDPEYVRTGHCPCSVHLPTLGFVPICLRRHRCRYSDSARVLYHADAPYSLGGIARPIAADPLNGPTTIAGAFRIQAERADPAKGDTLHKVGAASGWTFGRVTRTCVNQRGGSDLYNLCTTFVAAGARPGDSGAPVFAPNGPDGGVTLYGILWGGDPDALDLFVFSPMSGIERDLGQLTTFEPVSSSRTAPDLVPEPHPTFGFCRRDNAGRLVVVVRNQSNVDVFTETTTRVTFAGGVTSTQSTPPMPAGSSAAVTFDMPASCFRPDCAFSIAVDTNLELDERHGDMLDEHETNNIADSFCVG